MSAVFENVYEFTAKWEGGLTDDPNDSGGITNYGISLRFLRDVAESAPDHLRALGIALPVGRQTIRGLTRKQARALFYSEFWQPLKLDDIIHPAYACAIFDAAVNCGPKHAVKFAQRGFNSFANAPLLVVDGILGLRSRAALQVAEPGLASRIIRYRDMRYEELALKYPKNAAFLKGWKNRTKDLLKFIGDNWKDC